MALAHRAKVKDPAKAFISTWRTSIVYTGSTADNQIKLPLEIAGTYKFTVQWGDTTSSVITTWNQAETTHTYPAPGDYTVTITGFIKGWDFGQGGTVAPTTGDMRKLLTITQFGCLRLVTHPELAPLRAWGTFYGCTNLNLTAVQDMPNFKGTTSIYGFLRGCTLMTTINNVNKWDVSKIQIFRNTFRETNNFNQDIGNWNMSSAVSLSGMFFGSSTVAPYGAFNNGSSDSIKNWDVSKVQDFSAMFFNQPLFNREVGLWDVSSATNLLGMFGCTNVNTNVLGTFNNAGSDSIKNWDTSNVTNMQQLFQMQLNFNQDIGSWDVSRVTNFVSMFLMVPPITSIFNNNGSPSINNWNTSSAVNMSFMFESATNFNQPINSWNMSSVSNVNRMFRGAGAFNQPLGNWNVSNITSPDNFMQFRTDLNYSAANYDDLLIGWASRPVQPNRSTNFGTIKRTAASTAARAILTSAPNNWTIVDGGI